VFRHVQGAFVYAVPEMFSAVLTGLLPLVPLTRLSQKWTGSNAAALEITRGLPHNVTTEMDLALWQSALAIGSDPQAVRLFREHPSAALAAAYLQGTLPPAVQLEISRFLATYGMRGLGEIDIGRPRWHENPEPVLQVLQSFLQIEPGPAAPDAVFERSRVQGEHAVYRLQEAARSRFPGRQKARAVTALARRVRSLGGLRETPKLYIIRMMGIMREKLLEAGAELVENGVLDRSDDLFYLDLDQLEALAAGEQRDWQALVDDHRRQYAFELRRRQVPRLLLSDGRTFYDGIPPGDSKDLLAGSPVSPGRAEGTVRVVLDPHHANLQPGEILVCPGTDPSWTPLFLAAAGLVMESGGMMTHGAIIAREYGIPAVAGVDRATERLQTGERIRIDGSVGQLERVQEK